MHTFCTLFGMNIFCSKKVTFAILGLHAAECKYQMLLMNSGEKKSASYSNFTNSLQNCCQEKSKTRKALSKAFKKSSCLDSVPFLTDKQILD